MHSSAEQIRPSRHRSGQGLEGGPRRHLLATGTLSLAASAVPASAVPSAAADLGAKSAHQYGRSLFAVDGVARHNVWAVGLTPEDGTAIWHWNGSGWIAADHPGSATPAAFVGVDARTAKDAWAVGSRDDARSGLRATYTQRWNGKRWRVVPADPGLATSEANDVDAITADDAWLVGDATKSPAGYLLGLIEHWDGTSWAMVPSARRGPQCDASLADVAAIAANDVWAVGEEYCDRSTSLVEHWNGRRWSRVDVPSPKGASFVGLQGVTALSSDDVWAAGSFAHGLRPGKNLILHWNGHRWKLVHAPSPGTLCDHGVAALSAANPKDVWAAATRSCTGPVRPEMLHWDGAAWTKVHSPTPGFTDQPGDGLYGVVSLSKRHAFTVGIAKTGGGSLEAGFIERWNGKRWSLQ